jgi:hypothetical protein
MQSRYGVFSLCWATNMLKGSYEATPRSSSTTARCSLSSQMVGRRPLPPRSLASVHPDRRTLALHNLQARRPFSSSIACSRRLVPSGIVPGDVSVGCAEELRQGGEGARPNCFFQFLSRVLYAKKFGLRCNFLLSVSPLCNVLLDC